MTPTLIPATAATGSLSISTPDFETTIADRYDEAAQEILRFWFFVAKERNLSLSQLAQMTGLSTTVLSKILRGVYEADPASALEQLRRARATFHESASSPDFIDTALSRRMFRIFDKTRALRNVSILWGPMGIGKTECIMEYQRRHNHGRTLVVRFPVGASFAYFVSYVARAVGVSTRSQSQFHQRDKIIQVLSAGQRLLIIDELHQAFLTTRTDTAVRACEFLREISDVANCGLVLIGTEVLEQQVFRGPHKEALLQLVDRGTVQVPLPAQATEKDHEKFLQFYGLNQPDPGREPKAAAILADIIRSAGLRKLTLHLRDGAAFAARKNEPYDWNHFAAAFEAIQSLSR